jgi:hypothetical protein
MRSYHRAVAMWHCPHCGAPQAETARCWVCRKSSTTCSTCRHFRPSLISDIGFCALDRAHRPLTGRELRGCWTQRPAAAQPPTAAEAPAAGTPAALGRPAPLRGFVPLDEIARASIPAADIGDQPMAVLAEGLDAEVRTSLFGELDR